MEDTLDPSLFPPLHMAALSFPFHDYLSLTGQQGTYGQSSLLGLPELRL